MRLLVLSHRTALQGSVKCLPSKIRTAVGKSLTLRAALSAAMTTLGEGTRSYAKALFRLRCRDKIRCLVKMSSSFLLLFFLSLL